MSDQTWLWARGFEGGGPQAELLRRLAHWLMKEPELEAESLQAEITGDHIRITRHTMAPQTPAVTLTTPSGKTETLPLTHWNQDALMQPLFNPQTGALVRKTVSRQDGQTVALANARLAADDQVVLAAEFALNPRQRLLHLSLVFSRRKVNKRLIGKWYLRQGCRGGVGKVHSSHNASILAREVDSRRS